MDRGQLRPDLAPLASAEMRQFRTAVYGTDAMWLQDVVANRFVVADGDNVLDNYMAKMLDLGVGGRTGRSSTRRTWS